jgi:hypothetical protein
MTGTTNCLQSSNGFNPQTFSPLIPTAGTTTVSHSPGRSSARGPSMPAARVARSVRRTP